MRKFNLISFLLVSLIIVISCTKEDSFERNANEKPESGTILLNGGETDKTISGLKASNLRLLYCEWGWVWSNGGLHWEIIWCDCFNIISGNCLPDVIIYADNMNEFEIFKNHYNEGTLSSYFATDNYRSIFPGLDDLGVVDELKNGEIVLYFNHDVKMNKDFYFGLPQGISFSTNDTSWMSKTKCVLVIDNDF